MTKREFDLDVFPQTEVYLNFVDDDTEVNPMDIIRRVDRATEQYSLEEILEENDMTDNEALGILYELGYIGLPTDLSDEEDESVDTDDD